MRVAAVFWAESVQALLYSFVLWLLGYPGFSVMLFTSVNLNYWHAMPVPPSVIFLANFIFDVNTVEFKLSKNMANKINYLMLRSKTLKSSRKTRPLEIMFEWITVIPLKYLRRWWFSLKDGSINCRFFSILAAWCRTLASGLSIKIKALQKQWLINYLEI